MPCDVCIRTTLIATKASLTISVSTGEFAGLFLQNPYAYNGGSLASGNWSALGDTSGGNWTNGNTITGSDVTNNNYNDYITNGGVVLGDTDITNVWIGGDTSTSIVTNTYNYGSTITLNVDLSTTNVLLSSISAQIAALNFSSGAADSRVYDFLASSGFTQSSGSVFASFTDFQATISSFPIMALMNQLIPTSSDTWRPCFDTAFLWSGIWENSAPAGTIKEVCLDVFTGWNILVTIIRFAIMLGVFVWGIKYIWGGY